MIKVPLSKVQALQHLVVTAANQCMHKTHEPAPRSGRISSKNLSSSDEPKAGIPVTPEEDTSRATSSAERDSIYKAPSYPV